jgi:hypothetical protein
VRAFFAASAALLVSTSLASGDALGTPKSYLLVALPSLGSVTWRCGATGATWGLGYREFWTSATTTVTLRAGGRIAGRRTVNPHELVRFPTLRSPRQRLTFVQATEPGTLHAEVRVDFRSRRPGYANCAAYMPPRVTVEIYPRG